MYRFQAAKVFAISLNVVGEEGKCRYFTHERFLLSC